MTIPQMVRANGSRDFHIEKECNVTDLHPNHIHMSHPCSVRHSVQRMERAHVLANARHEASAKSADD